METDAEIARPYLAAVVSLARDLGLEVDAPQVLGAGANVVIHLAPSPVVARVATLTAEMRGGARAYLLQEREVSAALANAGLQIIAPTDLADPGPHEVDGLQVLLMTYRPLEAVDLHSQRHADAVGEAFVVLSDRLAGLPGGLVEVPDGQPWPEINTLLETVRTTTDAAAFDRVSAKVEVLRGCEPEDRWQLVHGDAHRVNVAWSDGQVVWFDFEDANRRPLAWDLATLRRSWPAAGDVACRLLGVDPASESMRWHHELRDVYALLWNLLYAQRYQRAVQPTAERLAHWLAEPEGLEPQDP